MQARAMVFINMTAAVKNTISVVIPTFNRAERLRNALLSVRRQLRSADEVIVVDDGSTDDTQVLLSTEFPEVVTVFQDNKGVSSARNLGIFLSRSEWIAFLDSDDEWLPEKLATQMKEIAEKPEYRICHSDEIWIRRGVRVNPMKKHRKKGGWIFDHCLPMCAISPSSVLIHSSVFESVGLFDENLPACEDYDLWLRISSRYPVLYVDQHLIIKYGGHDDQLSTRHWGMDRFRIQALENIVVNGELKPQDLAAAREMLVKKARIFCNGAKKRNKHQEYMKYDSLCRQYS